MYARSDNGRLFRSPLLWGALGIGIALRSVGLFQQIMVGDETFAFRFARKTAFPGVLWAYEWGANSPAFNAWLRLFLELGVTPSELALRIPVLASGIALLVVVPWWMSRQLGNHVAVAVAWLLALSPVMVVYSRFMRPYMPLALLGTVAAGAFYDWWRTGRRAAGVTYALAAAGAVYVNLLGTPFVLAPFVFLALEAGLHGRATLPPRREVVVVAGLLGAVLLVLVVPAWSDLLELLEIHDKPAELGVRSVRAVVLLMSGTGTPLLALALWAAVVVGGVRLARLRPDLLRFLLVICVADIVAVPILASNGIAHPVLLCRYLIVIMVPILTLAALGLTAAAPVRLALAPLLLAAIGLSGPLVDLNLYRNPLGLKHKFFRYDLRDEPPSRLAPPEPYRILATGPPGAVVECAFPLLFNFLEPLADYWEVHRRPIQVVPILDHLNDPRLGLRSTAADQPQPLLDGDAAFVVVHRDWREEVGVERIPGSLSPRAGQFVERDLAAMRREADRLTEQLERSWGAPDVRDDAVAIWDLTRVRARQGENHR